MQRYTENREKMARKGLLWSRDFSVSHFNWHNGEKGGRAKPSFTHGTYLRSSSLYQDKRANFTGLPSWVFYMMLRYFRTPVKMHYRVTLLRGGNKFTEVQIFHSNCLKDQFKHSYYVLWVLNNHWDMLCSTFVYNHLNNIYIVSTAWQGAQDPGHTPLL